MRTSILLLLLFSITSETAFAKFPKHSIMPMLGLSNTGIGNYTLRISHGLQVSYSSGDRVRTPLGLRYQYRMKKGNIFGVDVLSVNSPILITPQYLDPVSGFGGPTIVCSNSILGGNIHYSKTIDIKLIEVFGMAGFGAFFTRNRSNNSASNFTWYKGADSSFYDFAPVVSKSALKDIIPIVAFGCGVRFKHLEAGINNQISLASPIKNFSYNGFTHSIPLSWKSIGYYVAYRFEF